MWLVAWLACAVAPPSDGPLVDVPLDGVVLRVEPGSRVRTDGAVVQVDVADGRRWFDVRWQQGSPDAVTEAWAAASCEPVFWDEDVAGPGFLARGGLCTIRDRWHWQLVLARPAGDHTLLVAYVADRAFVPYEEAWVDFVRTALSVGADAPATTLSEDEIRRRVRDGIHKGLGRLPVPGGGLMSTRAHAEMVDVYAALPAPPAPSLPTSDQRIAR